jgi:molecular chaperone DnaK
MARTKIDYGIDLGTTNSAIARMDDGEIRIIKSDDTQSDTTPSCVHFNKKQIAFLGQKALNLLSNEAAKALNEFSETGEYPKEKNTYIEFKRTMGTDKKHESSHMDRGFSSEELSAEILKKLKSYIRDDNEVRAAIVTVPAMFQQHQVAATKKAAELAGFEYCELLQEPIAASMAYGLKGQNANGFWLVFDFGGGTFDAALMRVEEGIIKVHDTSGDNHLGGKNLDFAIVDDILIPYLENEYALDNILGDEVGRELLREALKRPAEEVKIEFASKKSEVKYYKDDLGEDDNDEELMLDITISIEEFEDLVRPIFQRSIDICHKMLEKNNLSGNDLDTVVLVGGPTFLETLRDMLRAQITEKIDVSTDPMTAVTKGAALFASTRDIPEGLQSRDKAKIQLKLMYPETTVETEEKVGIKVERAQTEGEVPDTVFAEISRNDKGWSSGKIEVVDDAEIIDIQLTPGKPNGFTVTLFDAQGAIYPCEPSSFTIIQGMKVANATLPMNVCVEALHTELSKQCIIPFPGLEKNKPLPAKGKQTFRTQNDLRPGNSEDLFEVRIFEAEEPYSRALPNEWIGTISITGEDLPQFLPKDSEVEITIELDASRLMKCSCYFPYLDESVDKESPARTQEDIPAEKLEGDIAKTQHSLSLLSDEVDSLDDDVVDSLETELDEINDLLEQGRNDHDRKAQVARRVGEVIKKIDNLRDKGQWPRAEEGLNNALAQVTQTQQRLGDEKTVEAIEQICMQADAIKQAKDTKNARLLTEAIRSLDFHMVKEDTGFWASYIVSFDQHFDIYEWNDRAGARRLIDEGKKCLATAPSKSKLEGIVRELFGLMPDKSEPIGGVDLNVLRH